VRPTTTKNNGRIGQLMDGFTQHSAAIEWNFGVEKSWLVPIFFGNLFDFFRKNQHTCLCVWMLPRLRPNWKVEQTKKEESSGSAGERVS
jgi:hypothetical protein